MSIKTPQRAFAPTLLRTLFASCLLTFGALLTATSAHAQSGSWWVTIHRDGCNDIWDSYPAYPNADSTRPPTYYDYGGWESEKSAVKRPVPDGWDNEDSVLPDDVSPDQISEASAAKYQIGPYPGGSRNVQAPGDIDVELQWCDSNGNPASSPPSSVDINIYSKAWVRIANYYSSLPPSITYYPCSSYSDYETRIASPAYDSYSYLDNGFGDTKTSGFNGAEYDAIMEGTHPETLTVDPNDGTAHYIFHTEAHSWFHLPSTASTPHHNGAYVEIGVALVP